MGLNSRSAVEDTRLKAKDTKKILVKDSSTADRPCLGQGRESSRPRTQAQVLSKKKRSSKKIFWRSQKKKKKKRSSQKIFRQSPEKTVFQKIFQALHQLLTTQKIVLSSSRGQGNFRGLEASRPSIRISKCVLEAKNVLEDSTSVLIGLV